MKPNTHNITSINVNGNVSFNGQTIAETFNKYFLSVAQNIHVNNHNINVLSTYKNPISYLSWAFNQPFPTVNLKCVSSKETEDITKSLKTKNSHRYEDISTKILKLSIYYISSPLTYIHTVVYQGGWFGGFKPPRNFEDISGVLDRMSKKNWHIDFLL
jgi:hypothetical protein